MMERTREEIENRIRELGRIIEKCERDANRCHVVLAYWENQDLKDEDVRREITRIDDKLREINWEWTRAEDEMYDLGKELFGK